jgi:hypothetical protein
VCQSEGPALAWWSFAGATEPDRYSFIDTRSLKVLLADVIMSDGMNRVTVA